MNEVVDTNPTKARRAALPDASPQAVWGHPEESPAKPQRRRRPVVDWFESRDPYETFLIGMALATIIVGAMVLIIGGGLG